MQARRRGHVEDFETILDALELAGFRMSPQLRARVLALIR
jgi:predicted nucleic acid-binding protein